MVYFIFERSVSFVIALCVRVGFAFENDGTCSCGSCDADDADADADDAATGGSWA
jgi:hypothetical protein